MRENPFNPANMERGRTPGFREINNAMTIPNPYNSSYHQWGDQQRFVQVSEDTIDELVNLLDTMTSAFEECGMFELAEQAKKISSLLN